MSQYEANRHIRLEVHARTLDVLAFLEKFPRVDGLRPEVNYITAWYYTELYSIVKLHFWMIDELGILADLRTT